MNAYVDLLLEAHEGVTRPAVFGVCARIPGQRVGANIGFRPGGQWRVEVQQQGVEVLAEVDVIGEHDHADATAGRCREGNQRRPSSVASAASRPSKVSSRTARPVHSRSSMAVQA